MYTTERMSTMKNLYTIAKLMVVSNLIIMIFIVYKMHGERICVLDKSNQGHLLNTSGHLKQNKRTIRDDNKSTSEDDFQRYGPGENGKAVLVNGTNLSLPDLTERNKVHGFNTFVSDIVSLHRNFPDMRPAACKRITYPENLPPISVVIIFRDEWWSILLRTVYSVLEHSPAHLINEIILVDDGSKDIDLLTRVKIHVVNVDKLKLVRNEKPLGLMMARQVGINAAKTDLFAVMDGHMEVGPGWLEPLIYRLQQKPKALIVSHIHVINGEKFEITRSPEADELLIFFDHVTLDQMWVEFSPEFRAKRNNSVEPLQYGILQGMMMVMRKDYFLQLGGFDPGMRVWGSEQIEISAKVWMCGGEVELIPCSTAAHMFR